MYFYTDEEGARREPSPIACDREAPARAVCHPRDSRDGSEIIIQKCKSVRLCKESEWVSYVALFAGGSKLLSVGRPSDAQHPVRMAAAGVQRTLSVQIPKANRRIA